VICDFALSSAFVSLHTRPLSGESAILQQLKQEIISVYEKAADEFEEHTYYNINGIEELK